VVLALLLAAGLRWLIVGAVLLLAWYLLAPLFTPASLARRRGQARTSRGGGRPRRARRKGPELEVIDGDGRILE
jgi:hypothetical protein